MKGYITNIKRFAVHDGDGIRTTVFFKGCPLKCIWCHNPETISPKREIAFYKHKCTNCQKCAEVCDCHSFDITDSESESKCVHKFKREKCNLCGRCEDVCPKNAIKVIGEEIDSKQLVETLIKDKSFYDESGGGITLSGGECLMQSEFCNAVLKELKCQNIHTAVDTCGYVSKSILDKVMPYTDIFLYDIKAIDKEVHIKYTGKSNEIILDNLKYIDSMNKKTEIRMPYIPEINDREIYKTQNFIYSLKNVTRVKILPYHNYAGSKYTALGYDNTLPQKTPVNGECKRIEDEINAKLKHQAK